MRLWQLIKFYSDLMMSNGLKKLQVGLETSMRASVHRTLAWFAKRPCSRLSIVRFANGPQRSTGHVLRAEKLNFLIRGRGRPTVHGARASGTLSIRGPEVSLGSLRVGIGRMQSPTPPTPPLPSVHTYKQGPLRSIALDHDLPKISIQSSLESPKYYRMR